MPRCIVFCQSRRWRHNARSQFFPISLLLNYNLTKLLSSKTFCLLLIKIHDFFFFFISSAIKKFIFVLGHGFWYGFVANSKYIVWIIIITVNEIVRFCFIIRLFLTNISFRVVIMLIEIIQVRVCIQEDKNRFGVWISS